MPTEIERKFLLRNEDWKAHVTESHRIAQGYLALTDKASIRVRIKGDGRAFLTIKSAEKGISRSEFDFPIPIGEAEALFPLCEGGVIDKVRYLVPVEDVTFEIDVFSGANTGLIVAELELNSEAQTFPVPEWLGDEVSGDPRYFNAALSRHPYREWEDQGHL